MVASEHRVVGHSTPRSDGPAKLTGREHYAGDVNLAGMVHARPVLSSLAHARLRAIDGSAALMVPGVVAVLTAADLPFDPNGGPPRALESVAREEVVFAGQPVAIVLAETEAAAAEGAALVQVDYEPLPAVLDFVDAMRLDSPLVRMLSKAAEDAAEAAMHGVASAGGQAGATTAESPNISNHNNVLVGDIAQGLAAADVTVEGTFRTAWVHQGYIEPQVALAAPDGMGGVTIYASTQGIYRTRTVVGQALGLPQHQVRIVPMAVGGGFGGKFGLVEPLTAALALAVKRPVRLAYTRGEEMLMANPTPAALIELKIGARRDGTITAAQGRVVCDTGAYPNSPLGAMTFALVCCYNIPSIEIRGVEVMTNRLGPGAYRAPGNPQASFAMEALIDQLADKLGMDRLALRIKNAPVEGNPRPDGKIWPRIGLKECLERLQVHPLWQNRSSATNGGRYREGIGIGSGGWRGGLEPATALCQMDPEGTIIVVVGAVDLTGTHTSFQLIAADMLGTDPEHVRVVGTDSTSAPYAGGAGGSKTLYTVGQAVERAAIDAREQLLTLAAQQLEAAVEDLEISGNIVRVKGLPPGSREISFKALAGLTAGLGARHAPIAGRGISAQTANAPGFAAHLARVRVDLDTGKVEILDYVAAQDVGCAINPAAVEGQIIGAISQGIGYGLYEQMLHDDAGQPITGSLMDYTLPRAGYVPHVETLMLEIPSPDGPYGARGVGEPPIIPVAATISNAIADAVGVRVNELPITPERLWQAAHGA